MGFLLYKCKNDSNLNIPMNKLSLHISFESSGRTWKNYYNKKEIPEIFYTKMNAKLNDHTKRRNF